jgi:hypothetical protein
LTDAAVATSRGLGISHGRCASEGGERTSEVCLDSGSLRSDFLLRSIPDLLRNADIRLLLVDTRVTDGISDQFWNNLVLCLRDRFRTLLPVWIDGTLLNNLDSVRTKLGSDIVISTGQSNGPVWGWDLRIGVIHKLPADSCGAASMNEQASTNWRSHPCRCERKGHFLIDYSRIRIDLGESGVVDGQSAATGTAFGPSPQTEQVSQVNRSPHRNRSPRN